MHLKKIVDLQLVFKVEFHVIFTFSFDFFSLGYNLS